ncbi:MAG: Crp/Fnr family transcriptional regulator [Chitinophagaceae bacterium]
MPSISLYINDRARSGNKVDVSALVSAMNYFHPLPIGCEAFFSAHVLPLKVPRKTIILREGELCDYIFFIQKGAIRGFTREGRAEITTWITVENELVTSIAGLHERAVSAEFIQTIEDCELLALPVAHLERMYSLFPDINITIRKLLQRYYWDAEQRAFIARLTKAERKYRQFLLGHQHLANRIPLKYIASYLGMTMETLSRIRKKLSEKV